MPVTVDWLNDNKRILHYVLIEPWTWDEVFGAIAHAQKLLDTVNQQVAAIVDYSNTTTVPENLGTYFKQIESVRHTHPNDSGITVNVNAQKFLKAMIDFVEVTNPSMKQYFQFDHASSVDEAAKIIEKKFKKQ